MYQMNKNALKPPLRVFLCSLLCFILIITNGIAEADMQLFALQGNVRYFEADGSYGLMDENGSVLLPAIYEKVEPFYGNISIVWKDGKGGCISKQGECVIDTKWDYIERSTEYEQDGLFIVSKDGKYGCLTADHSIKIPIIYNGLVGFTNGTAIVLKDGLVGVISVTGDLLVVPKWEAATYLFDGFVTVCDDEMNYGMIDLKGDILLNRTWEYAGRFSQERVVVKDKGLFGIVDIKGNIVSQCQWEDVAETYQNGLLAVMKNGRWGYINLAGECVISLLYEEADSFCCGLAAIKKEGKYGYINTFGEACIDAQYMFASFFQDEAAIVITENGG